jgi:hypothetical protein
MKEDSHQRWILRKGKATSLPGFILCLSHKYLVPLYSLFFYSLGLRVLKQELDQSHTFLTSFSLGGRWWQEAHRHLYLLVNSFTRRSHGGHPSVVQFCQGLGRYTVVESIFSHKYKLNSLLVKVRLYLSPEFFLGFYWSPGLEIRPWESRDLKSSVGFEIFNLKVFFYVTNYSSPSLSLSS